MLKITESFENGKTVRFRIDGSLTEAAFRDVESIFARHWEEDGHVLLLDMAGVVFMQPNVAQKLVNLRGEQLRIINCSPYIEALLETVTK